MKLSFQGMYKVNSKWIRALNTKAKIVKFLQELDYKGRNLHDFELGNVLKVML